MAQRTRGSGLKSRTPAKKLLEQAAFADFSSPQGRKAIFDWYNSKGLIPRQRGGRKYQTIEKFLDAVEKSYNREKSINPQFTPKQALNVALSTLTAEGRMAKGVGTAEALDQRNRVLRSGAVDYAAFAIDISESGKIRIGARSYGDELLSRPQEEYLLGKGQSQQNINAYKKWGSTSRQVALEENSQLRQMTGIEWDRGHFIANKFGGALTAFGSSAEPATINRGHGEISRGNTDALSEAGYSRHRIEDFFAYNLSKAGLSVQGQGYMSPADLEKVLSGRGNVDQILNQRYKQGKAGTAPAIEAGLVDAFMPQEGITKIKPTGVKLQTDPSQIGKAGPVKVTPGTQTTVTAVPADKPKSRGRSQVVRRAGGLYFQAPPAFEGIGDDPTDYIPRGKTFVTGEGPDLLSPGGSLLPVLPIAIP